MDRRDELDKLDTSERSLFWADEGFSTVGMALALLITLALVFTCAQVYEVNTASAQVQEVADASALAAENMVGEFYIVVSVCDALTFSLSLAMLVTLAVGVVCACVPPAAPLSRSLIDASEKLKKARDSFYDSAQESLEKLQEALPFIAAAKAQEVMAANSHSGHDYHGIAVLALWRGEEGEALSFDESDEALDSVEDSHEKLLEAADEAEEAAQEANEWKLHGWQHDSGSRDSYCMFERASHLAGLSGADNPFFSSVDTWDFSVALERARAYYRARYAAEAPKGQSVNEQANSALRKAFYAYAIEQVDKGYVHETEESFDALFPLLPKNTDEMRATTLYTDARYPVTSTARGTLIMHAWSGCPGLSLGTTTGTGAIRDMDGKAGYETCPSCQFLPSSMGKVAAASTSIDNGFEHHYNEVAKAAAEYEKARSKLDPLSRKVKTLSRGMFDDITEGLSEACAKRIDITPPGSKGTVVLLVDLSAPASHFPSSFVSTEGSGALGVRGALAAATLVREQSDEGKTVLTSLLDGFATDGPSVIDGMRVVLEVWSGCLTVYTRGHDALIDTVEAVLGSVPLVGASGLGTWAADTLEDAIEAVGFSPPDLAARKAVTVSSAHVLQADDSAFSARLLSVKSAAMGAAGDLGMDGVLSSVESAALDAIEAAGSEFEIATIVLFDGLVEIPVTVALPASVTAGLSQVVSNGIGSLRAFASSVTGVRVWQ